MRGLASLRDLYGTQGNWSETAGGGRGSKGRPAKRWGAAWAATGASAQVALKAEAEAGAAAAAEACAPVGDNGSGNGTGDWGDNGSGDDRSNWDDPDPDEWDDPDNGNDSFEDPFGDPFQDRKGGEDVEQKDWVSNLAFQQTGGTQKDGALTVDTEETLAAESGTSSLLNDSTDTEPESPVTRALHMTKRWGRLAHK